MKAQHSVILVYRTSAEAQATGDSEGKFVQLKWRDREYLIFADFDTHRYHTQILGQFLDEQGIPHHWDDPQHLDLENSPVAVMGGGRYRADTANKALELWDDSQAYGRFQDEGLTERLARTTHPWQGFSVRIH